MRIIDADLVVSKLQAVLDGKANEKESTAYFAFRAFIDLIDTEPTIDPAALAPRWMSVEERLPDKDGKCLIYTDIYFVPGHRGDPDHYKEIEISMYSKEYGFLSANSAHATYWMPLPEPPKEGENDVV